MEMDDKDSLVTELLIDKLCDHLSALDRVDTDDNLALLGGMPGISLALCTAGEVLGVERYTIRGMEQFARCLDNIQDAGSDTYGRGSCGVLTLYQFYIDQGIAEPDPTLDQYDRYLYRKIAPAFIPAGNYDLFHGLIGCLQYFLQRGCIRESLGIARQLILMADKTKLGISWRYHHPFDKTVNYNMGLAHGHPAALMALVRTQEMLQERTGKTSRVISDAIDSAAGFLYAVADRKSWAAFPTHIELDLSNANRTDTQSRLAWCYGDLGAAYALYRAARLQKKSRMEEAALGIIRRTTGRTFEQCGVNDASFCHGIAGIIYFYNRFHRITGETVFRDAAVKWLYVLHGVYEKQGLRGFDYYSPMDTRIRIPHPGLLEGYAGVLLALLALKAEGSANAWGRFFQV